MLFLPLGIRNYLEERAILRNVTLGSYLIQLVCKLAWDMGFKCDHPPAYRVYNKNLKIWKCKVCAMQYEKNSKTKLLGCPVIGFDGKPGPL